MKQRIRRIIKKLKKKLASLGSKQSKRDKSSKANKTFTITFAGDTSLGDYYLKKYEDPELLNRLENEPLSFFDGVKPLIKESDHCILNLETVLTEKPGTPLEGKEYPNYDNPGRMLKALKYLGVTAVSLANNHTMDFGPKLMLQTKNLIENAGIKSFGAGTDAKDASRPISFKLEGNYSSKKVYVLAAMRASKRYREEYKYFAGKDSAGVNRLKTDKMVKQIKKIRQSEPDALIIIFPHWQGFDYKQVSQKVHSICHKLIAAGADYVIGHGPHTINKIEKSGQGTIAYSIGNFVFNSYGRYSKLDALPYSCIVKINLYETNEGWQSKPEFYPIITDNKKTGFKVRQINTQESEFLSKKASDTLSACKLNRKKSVIYYECMDKDSHNNELFDFIMGEKKLESIDVDDLIVIEKQIDHLKHLHEKIDSRLNAYYKYLYSSKYLKGKNGLFHLYEKLSHVVKKEYLSYWFLKNFERRKINILKAYSFKEIMIENSELRRSGSVNYAWKLDNKINSYRFADAIGLRRPRTYKAECEFSSIDKQFGPVVVKPTNSTGSMGVYLVFNETLILSAREGNYFSSWEEVEVDVKKKLLKGKQGKNTLRKDEWIVEELILGSEEFTDPPDDVKFYCFYGEVLLISASNPAYYKRFCYWDAEMNMVNTGRYEGQLYNGNRFKKEDLEIAKNVSLLIPAPFIRLDMLNSKNGLVFGEITPRPGRFHSFNSEWDRKLGEAYRKAEARILRDLLNGKKFEAFTSLFDV